MQFNSEVQTCTEELRGGAVGEQVQREGVGVAAAERVAGDPHRQPLAGVTVSLQNHRRNLLQVALRTLVEASMHLERAAACQSPFVRPPLHVSFHGQVCLGS